MSDTRSSVINSICCPLLCVSRLLGRGERLAQGFQFFEALRDVAQQGGDPDNTLSFVAKRHDGELNGDPPAIVTDRWYREQITRRVVALPRLDRMLEASPVPLAQI